MRCRIIFAILIGVAAPLILSAQEPSYMNAEHEKLTPDRAIAAIRSKLPKSGTKFQVLREIQSSAEARAVASRAFQEALSSHVSLYNEGVFLDVLRSGGFLVLEIDASTDRAIWTHLVSSGTDGRPVVDSHEIQGALKSSVVVELMSENADFVEALLVMPPATARTLESRFSRGHFPEYADPSAEGFFGIPFGITKIKADKREYQELAMLSGAYHLWPIRYAMSLSIYPANPSSAVRIARNKHKALLGEFMRKNSKSADFIYELQDLESIRNAGQLRERISWLRRVNDFLDQTLQSVDRSPTPQVNMSISTIGLQLGSVAIGTGMESSFLVVTSPGLIVEWTRPGDGPWSVTRISLAEDDSHQQEQAESRVQIPPQ